METARSGMYGLAGWTALTARKWLVQPEPSPCKAGTGSVTLYPIGDNAAEILVP